jgi:hypothetical protein
MMRFIWLWVLLGGSVNGFFGLCLRWRGFFQSDEQR